MKNIAFREIKLKNRRVMYAKIESGAILRFNILRDGKVETTEIVLSDEALDAVVQLHQGKAHELLLNKWCNIIGSD